MTLENSVLAGIRAGVDAHGTHSYHWGDLRRKVFGGVDAWNDLKAWCADNALECELSFSEKSKATDVQFRKRRMAAAASAVS